MVACVTSDLFGAVYQNCWKLMVSVLLFSVLGSCLANVIYCSYSLILYPSISTGLSLYRCKTDFCPNFTVKYLIYPFSTDLITPTTT